MKSKRIIGILLTLTMIIGLLPITVSAAEQGYCVDIASGDITLTETDGVKYANGTAYEGELNATDSDTTVANVLTIESGEHSVTIDSVTAKQIDIKSGAKLNLTLVGENKITPDTTEFAAIHVPEGAELVITESSQGTVTATAKSYGAGIGGSRGENSGKITICGGTITATGAYCGAGIGGGDKGDGANITISGGTVTATSVENGAGIGGGSNSDGTNITISGGTVAATSDLFGAGIGGGYQGDGANLTISGGTVTATGGSGAAGIGGGRGVIYKTYGKNITISGGTVTATGGEGASGIGGYKTSPENVIVSPAQNCSIKVKETAGSTGIIGEYTVNTDIAAAIADYTNIYVYGHVDENDNHKCDVCDTYINDLHKDINIDHMCDICKFVLSECEDMNPVDHRCEVCNQIVSECDFDTSNGFCSVCGAYEEPELKDNYYQIENAGQFYWFANYINTVDRTANAVLISDIDLEGKSDGTGRKWTPIGSTGENSNNFRGHFDGDNHIITNLYVDKQGAGIGLFGEVRLGTVENFTIYGDVKLTSDCSYVGGVIGSAPGANGTEVPDHNGATIRNITSYVNVTLGEGSHGSSYVGGFMGYANHETIIENCSWYGTLDLGANRADSGVGGLVGRLYDKSSVTIRNCGAYGTIKTSYKSGTYGDYDTIYIGGVLSFSPSGTQAVFKNNLWAGEFIDDTDLGDKAHLSAFGTLNGEESVTNCYAINSVPYITTGNTYTDGITTVTAQQLASGEVAYKLGEAWGQELTKENSLPVLGDEKVYYGYVDCNATELIYSNIPIGDTTLTHNYENGFCTNHIGYQPATGSGTKEDPYKISNAGQLYWFAAVVNSGYGDVAQNTAAWAELTSDITVNSGDVSGSNGIKAENWRDWTPIGNMNNKYIGAFDGKTFTVSGLYFNDTNTSGVALFGYIGNNGKVQNVGVINSYLKGYHQIAGLAGNIGAGIIENCYFKGIIEATGNNIGGVVGVCCGEIINCYNEGDISARAYVGGVTGLLQSSAKVVSCYNSGDIYASGGDVGGIVGFNNNFSSVENCYDFGNVLCEGSNKGSVVGRNSQSYVKNCYYLKTDAVNSTLGGINGNDVAGQAEAKTAEQFANGEVAYLLGSAWGQELTKENSLPMPNGAKVYKYTDGYSNELKFGFADYTTDGAVFNIPTAGTYSLVFADYEGKKLNNIDIVPVTVTTETIGEIVQASLKGVTIGTGDKIMLWQFMTSLAPKCEAYIVK